MSEQQEHEEMKAKIAKKGKIFLIVGGIIALTAIILIILAWTVANFEQIPAFMFPGMFLLFIGMVLCIIGIQFWWAVKAGKYMKFFAKETAPATRITTEAATDGIASGLQKHGMGIGGKEVVKVKCRNCGYLETEDAEFCSKCGQGM